MDFNSIPPVNLIILALAVIGALYLIFKVGSKVIKALGLILILALAIFFWQGGTVDELKLKGIGAMFGDTPVAEMEAKYCQNEKEEGNMCQCVVMPVLQDLDARYSRSELADLDKDNDARKEAIKESMKNKQKEILGCMKDRGIDNVNELAKSLKE